MCNCSALVSVAFQVRDGGRPWIVVFVTNAYVYRKFVVHRASFYILAFVDLVYPILLLDPF